LYALLVSVFFVFFDILLLHILEDRGGFKVMKTNDNMLVKLCESISRVNNVTIDVYMFTNTPVLYPLCLAFCTE